MKRAADVVDLATERAARRPAVTRFVLEARDAGSADGTARFLWSWFIEDSGDPEQYRPSAPQIGRQLRRVTRSYDPEIPRKHGKRHRVRPRHG